MATNKFLIFDEHGNNMMNDEEYSVASQRKDGVVPGLADAEMHNKLYRQVSIMANAIGRVLYESNLDAPDDDVVSLAENIKTLFCSRPLDAYPVGSLYFSASAINPNELFGGTWEQIKGKFILAADESHPQNETGGSPDSVIPYHTHTFTGDTTSHTHTFTGSAVNTGTESANHTHYYSATTTTNGAHSHAMTMASSDYDTGTIDRGSGVGDTYWTSTEGNHTHDVSGWTGGVSANHTHSVTPSGSNSNTNITPSGSNSYVGTNGNTVGANMPPYISMYVWKRTA